MDFKDSLKDIKKELSKNLNDEGKNSKPQEKVEEKESLEAKEDRLFKEFMTFLGEDKAK